MNVRYTTTRVGTAIAPTTRNLVTFQRFGLDAFMTGLTFDMRGPQKAQPFVGPLDGRVRPHAQQRKPTFQTWNFDDGLHGQSVAVTTLAMAKSRCRAQRQRQLGD